MEYRNTDLYGGAIICPLPTTFADVSDLRQVPDHQEVWLDRNGFTSVVFDILERLERQPEGTTKAGEVIGSDEEALMAHLADIVEEDWGQMKVWSSSQARFGKLPPGTPAYTLFATSPPGEKQRGRKNEPDFVGILLTLVRLVEQKTDIVISINVPHIPGQYLAEEVDPQGGKHGVLLERALEMRGKILEGFEVREWGLFVQE